MSEVSCVVSGTEQLVPEESLYIVTDPGAVLNGSITLFSSTEYEWPGVPLHP